MGSVYEAVDRASGERVAVKTMSASSPRFVREAHALAELSHPVIVRYVAHGELAPEGLYLAMEWLDGETLRAVLRRGFLDVARTVTLGHALADALAHAHAKGFVHRDLKPKNVFATPSTRLVDFGLVRWLEGAAGPTRTGAFLGTPGFVAPEQALGERDVDARADVYALGCVMFACLAGTPFGRAAALGAEALFGDPPSVREKCPATPGWLDALLRSMMAHDRAARPTAAEVSAALAEAR
jgi:serine/threonine protein kinase